MNLAARKCKFIQKLTTIGESLLTKLEIVFFQLNFSTLQFYK